MKLTILCQSLCNSAIISPSELQKLHKMKKIVLVAIFAVAGLTASAQTEKGNVLLGGSIGLGTSKSDASGAKSSTNFEIMPKAGYFVSNNTAVGLGLGYEYNKFSNGEKSDVFTVAPFGRAYKNLSDQFKFFGELSVPLAFGSEKNAAGDKDGESTSIGVALAPGFAFFPTKKVAIELAFSGISYSNIKTEDANGNKVDAASGSSFNIGANFFAPSLGVAFHF